MKSNSRALNFEDVFSDQTKNYIKLDSGKYLDIGNIPIIDQGNNIIAGYANIEIDKTYDFDPVIVFGDHTRRFKYIDFPFCLGADGAKVLKPKIKADTKYLFHYLCSLDIENNGYSRHFKFLKRKEFILPPLAEQKRIAAILDKANEIKAKRELVLNKLDELTQSTFVEMFGDPIIETKKVYKSVNFEALVNRITYGFTSPMSHMQNGIPILTAKNIKNGYIDYENVHYANATEFENLTAKSKPIYGDILITKDGTIGRTAVVDIKEAICINQSVALVQPKHEIVLSQYIVGYLNLASVQKILKNMSKGNALAHLQITELAKLPIPMPKIAEQQKYVKCINLIENHKMTLIKSNTKINNLIASLQTQVFTTGFNA